MDQCECKGVFVKGEYVECSSVYQIGNGRPGAGYELGKQFKIEEITHSREGCVAWTGERKSGVYTSALKKVIRPCMANDNFIRAKDFYFDPLAFQKYPLYESRTLARMWEDIGVTKNNSNSSRMGSNSNRTQSLVSKFTMLLMGEPQKTFIKAGVCYENGELTSQGKEVFLAWLLKQNGTAFKKEVVDPILEEHKKDKKD